MGLFDFFTRKRESVTDTASNAFLSVIQGAYMNAESVSAVETSASMWEDALASASVLPAGPAAAALTPELLGLIGRSFVRRGEVVFVIDVTDTGELLLLPGSGHTIAGGANPASWTYEVTVPGPSGVTVVKRGAEGVVHCRYAVEAARPWKGISPLGFAASTGRLSGGLEAQLSAEASGKSGYVLPMPSDPSTGIYDALKTDLANSKGGTTFAETTSGGQDTGKQAAPQADFKPRRFGFEPPMANVSLRDQVEGCVLSIHGISPSLVQQNSDGTAQREAFRRFCYLKMTGIANRIAAEFARKLNTPGLAISFEAMRANDLATQARAVRALVGSGAALGMSMEEALRIVRLTDE